MTLQLNVKISEMFSLSVLKLSLIKAKNIHPIVFGQAICSDTVKVNDLGCIASQCRALDNLSLHAQMF